MNEYIFIEWERKNEQGNFVSAELRTASSSRNGAREKEIKIKKGNI